ncbi:MAG: allantoinase PuuE [Burkholderiaceae bacterium]|nr:allantoinase PuuE [Burkholderiaceae bacterium]
MNPRDFTGYGKRQPHPRWPGNARVALQIVMNYEEGSESSVLEGDATSEVLNSELVGAPPVHGRNVSVESLYEYGSRAGFWRLMDLFQARQLPITIFGVAMAMENNREATAAMVESGHEIACHGWRWINYQGVPEDVEREHMHRATASITAMTGKVPVGWYTGRASVNTRRLVVEHGGFLYDADSYADDLPSWVNVGDKRHLVVPYAFDTNDMRFAMPAGFTNGTQFFEYLRDTFDVLYAEGAVAPKMMSVGLHCRLAGRPGRMAAISRFLDHVAGHDKVWICRREDIARHWIATHG